MLVLVTTPPGFTPTCCCACGCGTVVRGGAAMCSTCAANICGKN